MTPANELEIIRRIIFTKYNYMALSKFRIDYSNHDYFNDVYYFFESFNDYIDRIDQLIEIEISSANQKLKHFQQEAESNPTWNDEIFDLEYHFRQKSLLKNIYYDSLILTLYAFIEKHMFLVCHRLENNQKLKIEDISGKGIFKYRTYLTKVINIDFDMINSEWAFLKNINKLRNFLVHSEGFRSFPKSSENLKKALVYFSSIELSERQNEMEFAFLDNKILKDFCLNGKKIIDHIYISRE